MRVAERCAWLFAAVGLLGCAASLSLTPRQLPHAWLSAFICWLAWALGSLALLLIHALTGGRWGRAIRPQLMAATATLPLLLPALALLLAGAHALYPWMRADLASQLPNHFYLNAPFFYVRLLVYVAVWLGLALLVLRALTRPEPERALARLAPAGLALLLLTVTFAAIDFTLSLEPRVKSSVYGLLSASEALLFALSVAVLAGALRLRARSEVLADLGQLLLGLLLFWAYLDFMQLLIIWQSDLPGEAEWYVRRLSGGWGKLAVAIAALHFLLPFLALLWPRLWRSWRAMAAVAALLVASELPRAWWTVIPAAGRALGWTDLAAMLALLGAGAAVALAVARRGWLEPRGGAFG